MRTNVSRLFGGRVVILLGLGLAATPLLSQTTGGATIFEGARLINGTGGAAVENAAIVVQGGRITAVGPAAQVKAPAGATRVSLAGKTVMPAIYDTHVHFSSERATLENELRAKAYYGAAVAMSMGQDTGTVAFEVRANPIPGAALFRTAGRGLTMPEPGRTTAPYWVTTEAEARTAVKELAANKVDVVKIWVDDRNGTVKKMPPEIYTPIIDEAHKQGLRVNAHLYNLVDAKGLLKAGLDAMAHGVRDMDIDNEFLGLVKQRKNLVLGPNLPDRGVKTDLSWLSDSVPPPALAKLQAAATDRPEAQQFFGIQARNLKKMADAGVRIVLGSDGNIPYAHHIEMADMVAAGLTPAQVIVAATRNSAEFMRLKDAGTLEKDKSADFVVLDANPLDDITNTRKMTAVYLRGVMVDRAALRQKWMSGGTN